MRLNSKLGNRTACHFHIPTIKKKRKRKRKEMKERKKMKPQRVIRHLGPN